MLSSNTVYCLCTGKGEKEGEQSECIRETLSLNLPLIPSFTLQPVVIQLPRLRCSYDLYRQC